MTVTRVFLYEFVTGGGSWSLPDSAVPSGSLLAEGTAMLQALAADLLAIGDLELHVLADSRLPKFWPEGCHASLVDGSREERRLLTSLAAKSDATLIIAPEFDDLLTSRCEWAGKEAGNVGGSLFSPDRAFVALATDKTRCAERLAMAGIAVPTSTLLETGEPPPSDFPLPAVLKPNDGAGSCDVRMVNSISEMAVHSATRPIWRLEAFQPGIPASVAVLCGPAQNLVLQPGKQLLSTDGHLEYLGSAWPLDPCLQARASRLAAAVIQALPSTRGYVGVDLVLGNAEDGSDDVVLEVNPRLTTSYVGLRQIVTSNLAASMMRVAAGLPTTVTWKDQPFTLQLGEAPSGAQACNG